MHRVSRRIDHLLHPADQLAQLLRRHRADIPAALDPITPLLQASDDPGPAEENAQQQEDAGFYTPFGVRCFGTLPRSVAR